MTPSATVTAAAVRQSGSILLNMAILPISMELGLRPDLEGFAQGEGRRTTSFTSRNSDESVGADMPGVNLQKQVS